MEREWGTEARLLRLWAPSRRDDPRLPRVVDARRPARARVPPPAVAWMRRTLDIDIRHVLPAMRVPTLVIHRRGRPHLPGRDTARYLAEHIPGARLLELPGRRPPLVAGDPDRILDEVESLDRRARPREPDRVLATVLFTDIVDSTRRAADLGDRGWRDLVESHDAAMRARARARHGGREVKTMGDGFLATFDGPARAIRCASRCATPRRAWG